MNSESIKILIIEDDIIFLDLLVKVLNKREIDTTSLTTTENAIQIIKDQQYDVVLTDIQLPGPFDGLELLIEIKKINDDLPVIVMSGYGNYGKVKEAINQNAYIFLQKPLDIEDIYTQIKNAAKYYRELRGI